MKRHSPEQDMRRMKAVLLLTATLAFIVSPLLAPDFRGYDPADFPVPRAEPLAQPASYAFSIWGLIYLWLAVHAGRGLLGRADDPDWDRPRWPLFVSVGLGASWLAVANAAPVVATVQIWVMLAGAIAALLRTPPAREPLLLVMPVALYAGWLTAAASVSVGVVLGGYGVAGEAAAAVVALVLATALAVWVQWRVPHAFLYGAGVIWALIGVAVANAGRAPVLALLAALAAGAVAVVSWRGLRRF